MKVIVLTDGDKKYYCQSRSYARRLAKSKGIDNIPKVVEMTEAEYNAIPATADAMIPRP